MAGELIYAFRVLRLPLLDAGGAPIGRIEDLVAIPGRPGDDGDSDVPPKIVGFVASSQRRRIFVNANRVGELNSDGVRLKSWDVDLNPFKPRPGEVLIAAELIDRKGRSAVRYSNQLKTLLNRPKCRIRAELQCYAIRSRPTIIGKIDDRNRPLGPLAFGERWKQRFVA